MTEPTDPAQQPPDESTPQTWQELNDVIGVDAEDRAIDEAVDRELGPEDPAVEGTETDETAGAVRMHDQPFTGPTSEEDSEEALAADDGISSGAGRTAEAEGGISGSGVVPPPTESATAAEMPTAESTPTVEAAPPAQESTPTVEAKPAAETAPPTVEAAPPTVEAKPAEAVPLFAGGVKLVIEQGLSLGKEFLVSDEEMLIGRRDPEQDYIPDIDLFDQESPNNRYISRRQAQLYFKEGGLWVEDLDSSNGTALNNHMVRAHEPKRLKPGDKLLLGQSVLLRIRLVAG